MQICVLGSGSRGNSTLVTSGKTSVLIDAGFSGKELRRRLELIGVDPGTITAVLLTHEHNDHISGAGVISRQTGVAIYANAGTYAAGEAKLGRLSSRGEFTTGEAFTLGDLEIHPFGVSHDTADLVGFILSDASHRVGYCTDTGKITTLIGHHLQGCDALVLESNHDPVMLREGPYPPYLQQRVRSNRGHLANDDAGRFLKSCLSERLTHVVLAHLSETNNLPELALQAARQCIDGHGDGLSILPAGQYRPTPVISLNRQGKKEP